MIDIETRKIVDILESRDYEEVERWLRSFPNLELISREGYTGSESLIRKFITDFRSETIEGNESVDIRYVEINDLISLLYKPIEKVETITLEEFEVVLNKYGKYKIIFNIVEEFKEILFGEDSTKINTWITKSKVLGIKELNSFITGIIRDMEAVENAIAYKYSNGLAEGKINKIKVIKRIMHGRCNRVLQMEYNT